MTMYATTADDRLNRAARAFACADLGALDEAIQRLEEALRQYSDDARVWRVAACFYMDRLGRGNDALAAARQALAIDPAELIPAARAVILAPDPAAFEAASLRLSSIPTVHPAHGQERDNAQAAIDVLSRSQAKPGDWVKAQQALADALLASGAHGPAAAVLDVLLRVQRPTTEQRVKILRQRASCLADLDDEQVACWDRFGRPATGVGRPMLKAAMAALDEAIALTGTGDVVDRLYRLEIALRAGPEPGDRARASALVDALPEPGPLRAEALLLQARIDFELGEVAGARRALDALAALARTHPRPGVGAFASRGVALMQRLSKAAHSVDFAQRLERLRKARRAATLAEPRTTPDGVEIVAKGALRRYPLARFHSAGQFVPAMRELLEDFSPPFCLGVLYAMRDIDRHSADGLMSAAAILADHGQNGVAQDAAGLLALHIFDEGDEDEVGWRFDDVRQHGSPQAERRLLERLRALDEELADVLARRPYVAPDEPDHTLGGGGPHPFVRTLFFASFIVGAVAWWVLLGQQ